MATVVREFTYMRSPFTFTKSLKDHFKEYNGKTESTYSPNARDENLTTTTNASNNTTNLLSGPKNTNLTSTNNILYNQIV